MKDTSYANSVNLLANKVIENSDTSAFDLGVSVLKSKLAEQIINIDSKQMKELKELKALLKAEIETNKKLYEVLKSYET
jgi:hypothetical protein